ncbi:hypothetical protein [Lysobacter gummosus]|uniref:hypothetical protein n=1 Tax=Lysobacter gummosus TaxID=262324 RepID=UPI00363C5DCE
MKNLKRLARMQEAARRICPTALIDLRSLTAAEENRRTGKFPRQRRPGHLQAARIQSTARHVRKRDAALRGCCSAHCTA